MKPQRPGRREAGTPVLAVSVDAKGREEGEHAFREEVLEPASLGPGPMGGPYHGEAFARESGKYLGEALVLHVDDFPRAPRYGGELLGRAHPEPSGVASPARSLGLEGGDSDHEELVEIRGDYRQEFNALEEGIGFVEGLPEDPGVELEPRELAVEIVISFCHLRSFHRARLS